MQGLTYKPGDPCPQCSTRLLYFADEQCVWCEHCACTYDLAELTHCPYCHGELAGSELEREQGIAYCQQCLRGVFCTVSRQLQEVS